MIVSKLQNSPTMSGASSHTSHVVPWSILLYCLRSGLSKRSDCTSSSAARRRTARARPPGARRRGRRTWCRTP
eukprot:7389758-Prymnesium_polylepis.1